MAKAKYVNEIGMADTPNIDINLQEVDEILNPDLLLRTFGISDDYGGEQSKDTDLSDISILQSVMMEQSPVQKPVSSVIMKTNQMLGGHTETQQMARVPQDNFLLSQAPPQPALVTSPFTSSYSPVTLQPRKEVFEPQQDAQLVSIPMSTLEDFLAQSSSTEGLAGAGWSNNQRKRTQQMMNNRTPDRPEVGGAVFTVPSPLAVSPVYVEGKLGSCEDSGQLMTVMRSPAPLSASRPSPQSTPPLMETGEFRGRKFSSKSGRTTPTGKRSRSRPQTPTSDCESEAGYRDREPHAWASGRNTPVEQKPSVRLEDLVDEDKYNKRKRSTSGGDGKKKDPMKSLLEQLQQCIPHIGNPDEEKVSHAGLLMEGSDYVRSLCSENDTVAGQVEHFKQKIDQLHAEIEAFQEKLPEHGAGSIHRILSKKGKSIPDMFADHVRQKTQEDWRYWVFTSIMGHFVHNFSQEVSNISPAEMERTAGDWLQERMSMSQLRKDAFRKLAKLCAKTSIMEDPSKLPEEARGFVALAQSETEDKSEPEQRESRDLAF